jgi:carbonic anhydrase
LCESGQRQSPIDIRETTRQTLPALTFHYVPAPLKLADDGHTVRVRFPKGSTLQIGNERYTLQQFHFHTPGGDKIAGEEFPMAAHLLHKSPSGQLLAVVVLFRIGQENALLKTLLPLIPARADGDHSPAGCSVRCKRLAAGSTRLFPVHRVGHRHHPAPKGLTWMVLKQPLLLSSPNN